MTHWAQVRLSVVGLCVLAHSRHFPPGDMPKSLDCWQHVVRPSEGRSRYTSLGEDREENMDNLDNRIGIGFDLD